MASRGGKKLIVWPRRHMHAYAEALIYMAVMLQLLGVACALVAGPGPGKFRLPEIREDGLYQGFVDENGETQVRYLGKGNTTRIPGPRGSGTGGGGPGRKLLDTGVHCQGSYLNSNDAYWATAGLANSYGGTTFTQFIAYGYGQAVAYGCDYGNSQTPSWDQIWSDGNAISNICGGYNNAGWDAHESWKSSYGRCPGNWAFC